MSERDRLGEVVSAILILGGWAFAIYAVLYYFGFPLNEIIPRLPKYADQGSHYVQSKIVSVMHKKDVKASVLNYSGLCPVGQNFVAIFNDSKYPMTFVTIKVHGKSPLHSTDVLQDNEFSFDRIVQAYSNWDTCVTLDRKPYITAETPVEYDAEVTDVYLSR